MQTIKKILFVSPPATGDTFLALPSFDLLRESFGQAQIWVLAGPQQNGVFGNDPAIHRIVVYDKKSPWIEKLRLFFELKRERFDCVVDLHKSFFGLLLPSRHKIAFFMRIPSGFTHLKDRYLYKTRKLVERLGRDAFRQGRRTRIAAGDRGSCASRLLGEHGGAGRGKIVVIAPGAGRRTRPWPADNFGSLAQLLIDELDCRIVIVGDRDDMTVAHELSMHFRRPVTNLAGKTSIGELAAVIEDAALVITNDSAVLHIASYQDIPVIAIFGNTDETVSGPWSDTCVVLKKDIDCRPCRRPACLLHKLECLRAITVTDCYMAARDILNGRLQASFVRTYPFNRILVARTDRVGDVLLSTPVLKNLRVNYPDSFIAVMVSPQTAEIVRGNPYVDEVILLDKDGRHGSWWSSFRLAQDLRRKNFDLALVLHPTARVHLLTFFAGIPRRVGFDRKSGFLLTDTVKHTKQWGAKHELEYNLDILRYLGIRTVDKGLFMPVDPQAEAWAERLFAKEGIRPGDKVLVIHPGASCPSKIWPHERFARVSDALAVTNGLKVVLIAGPKDMGPARQVAESMKEPVINLAGKTSLLEVASVLKRAVLFISNDSGPVHIASSLGVPVISIFGRKQAGLGPVRWGPIGPAAFFLHKDAGCIQCLAHDCQRRFLCLRSITVDDVLGLAHEVLKG